MKWFKHFTDGYNEKDIKEGIRIFGIHAYSFYYILNEIYGLYYNELDNDGFLTIEYLELEKAAHLRRNKVILLLKFFEKKNRLIYIEPKLSDLS